MLSTLQSLLPSSLAGKPGPEQNAGVDYLAFSLWMLAAQFSPGPDMLLLIRNSLAHPARAGLFTVLGIAAGLTVHLTAVFTGLALAVRNSPAWFSGLMLVGGVWLIWLGLQVIRSRPAPVTAMGPVRRLPLGDGAAFLQGLLTNLTNLKAILFLATVMLAWLGENDGWSRKGAAAAIILGQALLFWSLFVLALQHPVVRRGWHRTARPLHLIFGLGLILLGAGAVWDAASRLPALRQAPLDFGMVVPAGSS